MGANNTMYDVPDLQGGSGAVNPGSAAYYGFQRELMRRQQQEATAVALARQAQEDELNRRVKEAGIANTTEATKGLSAERAAQTAKTNLGTATLGLTENQPVDETTAATIRANGGGGLLLGKPATPAMTMGVPSQFSEAPDAASAASGEVPQTAAAPASTVFKGTDKQQEDAKYEKYAQEVLNGEHATGDPGIDRQVQAWASSKLMGKEMTGAAGVINPKDPAGTKAADDLAIEKIYYDRAIAAGKSPSDAKVEARDKFNEQQAKQANTRSQTNIYNTNDRQDKTQLFQTKQGLRASLTADFAKLSPDMDRVERAKAVLASPNFLADAVAAPEVLQIMAGGMGSGLRMTDAELRRVNEAQNKLDQFRGFIAKYGIGKAQTIQDEMRANMKALIDTVEKARLRQSKVMQDTMRKVDSAESQEELDKLHADYMEGRTSAAAASNEETPEQRAARLRKAAGL